MKCKFCGEEMPERGRFCSMCGRDNSVEDVPAENPSQSEEVFITDPAVEIVPPETDFASEEQDGVESVLPQAKKMKRIAILSGCVAALAVLALVLFFGVRGGLFRPNVDPTQGSQATTGTIPPDGNPNDATCKGSYTVSDQQAIADADVVVATLGDAKLTNGQLQIYYQMEIIEFLNQYGYYLSYFGMDYTKPLDQQACPFVEGYTWQQYFLECALSSWQQAQVLATEAGKTDFVMDSEYQQQLDSVDTTMATSAAQSGFASAEAFLQAQCGANTTMADYKTYMQVYFNGYLYFAKLSGELEVPTDDMLADYFLANKESLESQGIKQDGSYLVDVRHILIMVDGGVENSDGTISFPDEALAAEAYANAQSILEKWLENPTEENFAALAKEHTDDGNGEAGGLYTGVYAGQMVKSFNDWCFDESRQSGDYGIVTTKFGYHIMYFSARSEETWLTNTRQAYMSQKEMEILEGFLDQYEFEITYDKIALAYVSLV